MYSRHRKKVRGGRHRDARPGGQPGADAGRTSTMRRNDSGAKAMHTPSDNDNDTTIGTSGENGEAVPVFEAFEPAAEPVVGEMSNAGKDPDTAAVPPVSGYDELRAERDAYLDLARRERADFDNYRKRIEREMGSMKKESLSGFLKEFFSPLDDLDRVLVASAKEQSYESLATGVRMMEEKFWRVLAKAGVRKIDALGKPFDPTLHEAMVTVPSADMPANTVMEVYENGYKLDDHILRPARVVVSREP